MTTSPFPLVPDSAWNLVLQKETKYHKVYTYHYPTGPTACPVCKGKLLVTRRLTRTYEGLPEANKRVSIRVHRMQYTCQNTVCGRVYSDAAPSRMSQKHSMTKQLEEVIARSCPVSTNTALAQQYQVSERTIASIRKEYGIPPFRRGGRST